jgi:sulfatase modifying factor 1
MLEDSARPPHGVVSALVSLGALVTLAVACGPGNVGPNLAKPPTKSGVTKREAAPLVVTSRPSPAAAPQAEVAGMVSIPAGSFMMGSNEGEADEKPVHRVSVAGFAMDVTEVTTVAYTACVRAGRCSEAGTSEFHSCNYGLSDKDNHPINCVDWDQATAYCASVGKRLPTEEEWEYAASGTDGRTYPWGNEEPGTRACWDGEGNDLGRGKRQSTCSVGSYASRVFGLKDMAGNVWEWTSSGYSHDYNAFRVVRGGSWIDEGASLLRSSDRSGFEFWDRHDFLGFRCAR